jgi:cytochrome bd-type quinol oxidase subunit 2
MPGQSMPSLPMPIPGQQMPGQPMPYGQQMPYGQPQYGMPGYGMPVPQRPVSPGVLFGVSVWRLVIVVFAITGFSLAMASSDGSGALAALSQQASLVTAICYAGLLIYPAFTGGQRHEPNTPWLRGALVVLLALVSITFLTMLGGGLNDTWSLFEHLLTPLAVLIDWLVVGTAQRNARWWFPFTWLAFPVAYLLFYIAYVGGGDPIYPFLDPSAGDFVGIVFAFLAGVLAFGFVVLGIGKMRGSISTR